MEQLRAIGPPPYDSRSVFTERMSTQRLEGQRSVQMPVFFLLGRRDRWVPPETSVSYFNALKAPSKTVARSIITGQITDAMIAR